MCGPAMQPTHAIRTETRFLRLRHPVELGSLFGEWRVSWLGGWDKGHIFYLVMVARAVGSGQAE